MGIFASLSRNSALLGLHFSEGGLLIAGIILAIGIIGEMRTPTGFPILWSRLRAFELLVLIGVMGELISDGGVFIFSERLQEISDSELQSAIKEAGEGRRIAGKANERAARSDQRSKVLEVTSELLKKQNLILEERLAHRRISPEQHRAFVAALKPYKGAVVEFWKLEELEASTFADDLLSVLRDSGWRVYLGTIGIESPPQYGLKCLINEESPAGKALASVIKQIPTASVKPLVSPKGLVARIFVELKPPP